MKLILLRIPKETREQDIRQVVEQCFEKKFKLPIFGYESRLLSIKIIEHIDPQKVKTYHGVMTVHPDKAGKWLLKKFKSQKICGKNCYFREYFERKDHRPVAIEHDHRAGNTVEEKIAAHLEGVTRNFSRKQF